MQSPNQPGLPSVLAARAGRALILCKPRNNPAPCPSLTPPLQAQELWLEAGIILVECRLTGEKLTYSFDPALFGCVVFFRLDMTCVKHIVSYSTLLRLCSGSSARASSIGLGRVVRYKKRTHSLCVELLSLPLRTGRHKYAR